MSLISMPEAVAEVRAGRPLIVVDDPHRENEGDLIVAASCVTPDHINFMVTHARGLVCVPMTAGRLAELDLPLMVERNTTPTGTAFTVPVDARHGTTTGISAFERSNTIRVLIDPATRPVDLLRPGHTEAAVDLARLAGHYPAGVVCEILDDDGHMARGAQLVSFALRHGLGMLAIADLIAWRAANDPAGSSTQSSSTQSSAAQPGLTLVETIRSSVAPAGIAAPPALAIVRHPS